MSGFNRSELLRTVKFVLFSISAGVIQLIVFTLMHFVTKIYWPCYLIALIASVLWNFTLNREFTFKSAGNIPIAMAKVALFYAVFTPVSTLAGNYFAEGKGVNDYIVTFLTMVCNLILEYLYDRIFVFGKTIDTKQKKE